MTPILRGALAALFFSGLLTAPIAAGAVASSVPGSNESGRRADGLSYRVIGGGASPTEALEVWFRCPADGYVGGQAGIARLAALAIADANSGGASLRDIVRDGSGTVAVQVFPAATEIGVVVPAYVAGAAQDALLNRIFRRLIDDKALKNAKLRMAEELALAEAQPDVFLRERVFSQIFSDGPYRDSTFGTAATLEKATLADVQTFIADAFRPANAMAVSVGLGSQDAFGALATSSVLSVDQSRMLPGAADESRPLPHSTVRTTFAPVTLPAGVTSGVSAVALGWVGPPISDERAATAMDFLSDYLMRDGYGAAAKGLAAAQPRAAFDGQFITLQNPGVMFAGVWGVGLDRRGAVSAIRSAVNRVVDAPLSGADFAQALIAFRTHLSHDMDGPQPLADNFGWYFAQGAPEYTPGDMIFSSGGYDVAAKSLTADFVHSIARRYLSSEPAIVTTPDSGGSVVLTPQHSVVGRASLAQNTNSVGPTFMVGRAKHSPHKGNS